MYHILGWGDEPQDRDAFVLSRLLMHLDAHYGKYFRMFGQLQSSQSAGQVVENSPVEENQLEIHQLFVDVYFANAKNQALFVQMGRQQFSYGSQRLVAVREAPNNRQSFDAIKGIYKATDFRGEVFYSSYVIASKNIFDDRFLDPSQRLWGSYLVVSDLIGRPNVDLYYLGIMRKKAFSTMGLAASADIRQASASGKLVQTSPTTLKVFTSLESWNKTLLRPGRFHFIQPTRLRGLHQDRSPALKQSW